MERSVQLDVNMVLDHDKWNDVSMAFIIDGDSWRGKTRIRDEMYRHCHDMINTDDNYDHYSESMGYFGQVKIKLLPNKHRRVFCSH